MVLPSWNTPALSPTPQRPLHDEQQQLQRREVVPTALILCISSSLRQASTTQRTKLFQLSPYVQAPRIVHNSSPAPSLDSQTHQTLSVLLPRPFCALLVAHVLDVFRCHGHDANEVGSRSIKRVGCAYSGFLYIHFSQALSHRNKYAYLRKAGGRSSSVRLPHLIS